MSLNLIADKRMSQHWLIVGIASFFFSCAVKFLIVFKTCDIVRLTDNIK